MPPGRISALALSVTIMCCLSLVAPPNVGQATASSSPMFGAWAPPSPWSGLGAVEELETTLGRQLDIVHVFETWENDYRQHHTDMLNTASRDGRRVLLSLEPWNHQSGSTEQPEWALSTFARGDHDARIREWARGLRDLGTVVYLRPMHEMNGDWYPWSGVRNGNSPDDYLAAWRHIHDLFRAEGATNVRWVWAPNVTDIPHGNAMEQYYPGHAYVDVLGLDGYNWGTSQPDLGGWKSFDLIYADAYRRVTALGPQPVWLTEVASDETGGDKAEWVRDMFATLAASYPRVEAVVWFNEDKERRWPVTSSEASTAAFVKALAAGTPAPPEGDTPTGPTSEVDVQRFAGRDRIHTARLIAEHGFGPTSDKAVIARADDHADALAGAALAGSLDGPVLLTARDRLSDDTAAAIISLQVQAVVLLGGTSAITPEVEEALRDLLGAASVTRIAGVDRFATAAAAAAAVGEPGDLGDGRPTALLANGSSFADALSAGPIAWQAGIPLLLTGSDALPPATMVALDHTGVRHVVAMGGQAAISEAVLDELRDAGFTVERVSGPTRGATAAAMARLAVERLGWPGTSVALARGDAFPDALAMGPLAGAASAPLVLTASPLDLGVDATTWLGERGCTLASLLVAGGTSALSTETAQTAQTTGRATC